ncbi:MAG: hypothetical protein MI724_16105 [Spirochaetales bacterium]|nr:hypothetical protein [Spirochaetales bacterium]
MATMPVGEWYRAFGTTSPQNYFEVARQGEDGRLLVRHFQYDSRFRRVLRSSDHYVEEREWLDLLVANDIVRVERDRVPFLMSM